jgi:hypothetical protein
MVEKKKVVPEEDDKCIHPLMCADEWKDPEGATVLAEYHKDDETDDERRIEEDLDAFENYWQKKHGINFQGEYHKEGAPYMESSSGWDGHRPRSLLDEKSGTNAPTAEVGPTPIPNVEVNEPKRPTIHDRAPSSPAIVPNAKEPGKVEPSDRRGEGKEPLKISEVVDINTIEVISYWIFRIAFGKELHIPIKKEGVADIDVHINNKDVVVNTNQLYFAFPELVVWHITYTHKGRPVLEIGRGVKKGLKVHRINALRLLLEVWMGSKRAEKESKMAELKQDVAAPISKGHRTKESQDLNEKGDIT